MTLHFYFARKFLLTFLAVALIFAIFLALLDFVEEIRRNSGDEFTLLNALELTLLKLPGTLYEFIPLIMILSSLAFFIGMARSSELVVTRAAGRSALKALMGPFLVSFGLGVLAITVLNPIVAVSSKRYETVRAQYHHGATNTFSISSEGLWLRESQGSAQMVIRASAAAPDGQTLQRISFFMFSEDGVPFERIEAETAVLGDGYWEARNAKKWLLDPGANPEAGARNYDILKLPSELTHERLEASIGDPSSVGLWELPAFIAQLDNAGFSPRRHEVWYQTELARPLFLAAMMLVGAAFTMRPTRFGGTGMMVISAILLAFTLYFMRNFAMVLGETGKLPISIAAWAPPFASLLLALGLILHTEDG